MSSEAFIEVRSLSRNYGSAVVLEKLDFDINKGEIFGLLGPNGAGKTTFLSILTTLLRPTSGDIYVNSISVSRQPDKIKKLIGYVPQDIALYPALSGSDNLKFWAGIYGLTGNLKKERINEALSVVMLEDRSRDRVSEYSGGMKRRLNIAAAILHKPDILVMDEPTAGVDIQSRRLIANAVRSFKHMGKTVVFTSHDISELEALCDRIAIISKGRIAAIGTAGELNRIYCADSLEEIMLKLE